MTNDAQHNKNSLMYLTKFQRWKVISGNLVADSEENPQTFFNHFLGELEGFWQIRNLQIWQMVIIMYTEQVTKRVILLSVKGYRNRLLQSEMFSCISLLINTDCDASTKLYAESPDYMVKIIIFKSKKWVEPITFFLLFIHCSHMFYFHWQTTVYSCSQHNGCSSAT